MSNATLNNDKPGGDIFDAINFVLEKITDHCKKKKYNKRVFVFTNGMGETSTGIKDLSKIVSKLKENDIKLNIITLDFMEDYDLEENTLQGGVHLEPAQ